MSARRKAVTWRSVAPLVIVIGALTVAAGVWYAMDEPPVVPADELHGMLRGNTVDGLWGKDEVPYRQYVEPGGTLVFSEPGGTPQTGTWQIRDNGAFCALWVGGAEACLLARRQGQTLYWLDPAKSLGYPFRVLPGRQLEFDAGQSKSGAESLSRQGSNMASPDKAATALGHHAGF